MKDKTKKFAIGAIIAAIAGYITGILTAPKSGKQTRQDISSATVKARSEAEKKLKILHSELDTLLEKAKQGADKVKKEASKGYAEAMANAQLAKEKAREILSAVHEGDADDKDLQKAVDGAKKSVKHLKAFLVKK